MINNISTIKTRGIYWEIIRSLFSFGVFLLVLRNSLAKIIKKNNVKQVNIRLLLSDKNLEFDQK